jgi:hypothetical protein
VPSVTHSVPPVDLPLVLMTVAMMNAIHSFLHVDSVLLRVMPFDPNIPVSTHPGSVVERLTTVAFRSASQPALEIDLLSQAVSAESTTDRLTTSTLPVAISLDYLLVFLQLVLPVVDQTVDPLEHPVQFFVLVAIPQNHVIFFRNPSVAVVLSPIFVINLAIHSVLVPPCAIGLAMRFVDNFLAFANHIVADPQMLLFVVLCHSSALYII